MDFTAVYLALASFAIFLAYAIASRVGRHPATLRRMAVLHLAFAAVYLGASFLFTSMTWSDRLIGLFVYVALKYPFLFILLGQAMRGFSLNICVAALQRGGTMSAADIFRSYGDGKGVEYVKSNRIRVMLESGAAVERDGALALTRFGRFTVLANRYFLRLFGLDYLGKGGAAGE